MPKALPVLRLQFVQWHTPCIVGPELTVMDTCPQAQEAVMRFELRIGKVVGCQAERAT